MRRTLDSFQITMVEAVYLCVIKKPVSKDMQDAIIELLRKNAYVYLCIVKKTVSKDMQDALVELLRKNAYMYTYLGRLLHRLRPLYSKYDDHLPKKYAT